MIRILVQSALWLNRLDVYRILAIIYTEEDHIHLYPQFVMQISAHVESSSHLQNAVACYRTMDAV